MKPLTFHSGLCIETLAGPMSNIVVTYLFCHVSSNPQRAIKAYLESVKLSMYARDSKLIEALASPSLETYSKRQAEQVISSAGLKVFSWVPTATMSPYGE
jgi:hypothetical protein